MADEEKITYAQIKQQEIRYARIIVKRRADKSDIFLEPEKDKEKKKQIGENIDVVFLYGVRAIPEAGGPFFVTIIEEGILAVHEEVLYKISEEKDGTKNMRIYIPIW